MASMFQPVPPPIYARSATDGRDAIGEAAYVNPDFLLGVFLGRLRAGVQLRSNKSQHVLPATEEDLASGIVCAGLPLIKALERILLVSLEVTLVWLEKGGVEEEEEGLQKSGGVLSLLRLGNKSSET
jgi:hypothetical protein